LKQAQDVHGTPFSQKALGTGTGQMAMFYDVLFCSHQRRRLPMAIRHAWKTFQLTAAVNNHHLY